MAVSDINDAVCSLLTDRFVSFRFHACRYPNTPSDTAHKFDPATHNHVVFVRNNRFFEVQLARADGTELSAADLETYASLICFSWGGN